MLHRSRVVTLLLAEIWLAFTLHLLRTGMADAFPAHMVTSYNGSSKLELSSLTAGAVETMESTTVNNSSSWYAITFHDQDQSGRDGHRHAARENSSDRATRDVSYDDDTECFPSPEQLESFPLNVDDPSIAAAISLSRLAEAHGSQFQGIPRDRLAYKRRACDITTHRLNAILAPQHVNGTAPCRWNYTCSYEDNRYPQYIVQAVCQNNYCSDCDHFLNPCRPIRTAMHVLRWTCSSSSEEGSGGSPVVESLRRERIDLTLACRCNLPSVRYQLTA